MYGFEAGLIGVGLAHVVGAAYGFINRNRSQSLNRADGRAPLSEQHGSRFVKYAATFSALAGAAIAILPAAQIMFNLHTVDKVRNIGSVEALIPLAAGVIIDGLIAYRRGIRKEDVTSLAGNAINDMLPQQ